MSIPARLRRVFDAGDPAFATANNGRTQLVAVYGPDWWNWIELYTIEAIEEIDEQIDRLTRGSPQRRWLELLMNGQSTDLEIDREGRLVLPQKLREKLGLHRGRRDDLRIARRLHPGLSPRHASQGRGCA